MNDLISRAAAIKAFTGKPPEYYHTSYIVGELKVIPAVDAVPVVRCKDCKHYDGDNCCMKNGLIVRDDVRWFCADGEKEENNATD